jgi:sugar phosphate permease
VSVEHATASLKKVPTLISSWRWVIALTLLSAIVSGFFDRISVAVLFTNKDFYTTIGTGFNPAKLGLLMTAFFFAYGVGALVLGFVGDIFGPRRTLGISAGIWGAIMILMGSTSSYGLMLLYRIALGIAEGPQFSLISKVVKRWFPSQEHARANSIWMVGNPIGSAIGFPLTIYLVAVFGWRISFYVLGAISFLVVMPLILAVVSDWPPDAEAKRPESISVSQGYSAGFRSFIQDYRYWLMVTFNTCFLIYLWGLISWLPSYLEKAKHFNLSQMGLFSSLPFMLMFLGVVSSGIISDWLGRRAIFCFIGLFGAGVLMYWATTVSDPHGAAILIALSAGFWGLGLPTNYAIAIEIIPPSVTSSGIGIYNGIGNLISAFAPVLIGWIIGRTGSFDTGLLVLVCAAIFGSCMVLPLVTRH